MDTNDTFDSATQSFVSWLLQVGVQMNPKMAILDMRSEGRGRGVGKTFLLHTNFLSLPLCHLLTSPTTYATRLILYF